MKKPNIDLSQEGLKNFFFLHSEKLILGLSAAALGVFFWFGFNSEVFKDMEPAQLTQKADQANAYIVNNTSWEKIEEFRQADNNVYQRIAESNTRVNVDEMLPKYELGYSMGTPVRTLGLRQDPVLIEPEDLVARYFRAPLLIKKPSNYRDRLADLPVAGQHVVIEDDRRRDDRNEDRKDRRQDEEEDAVVGMGEQVPEYQYIEKFGLNPIVANAAIGNQVSVVRDAVVVTGLFDLRKQWNNYEQALRNARGYYPPRDKPNFRRLQIQRSDDQGQTWQDVTRRVYDVLPEYYVGTTTISGYVGAPEVVHPKWFDPALSGPIPSFTQFDYAPYALHVNQTEKMRRTMQDEVVKQQVVEEVPVDDGNLFSESGFQDFDKTNNRSDRNTKGRGDRGRGDRGRGGSDGMFGDRGGRDRKGGGGNRDESNEVKEPRRGSDYVRYQRIINSSRRHGDFRLVRFYDLEVEPNKTYQYRVRVWLEDPNNAVPQAVADQNNRSRGKDNLTVGGGGSAGEMEREDGGNRGGGTGGDMFEDEETYQFVAVSSEMKDKRVRARLSQIEGKNFDQEIEYQKNARSIIDAEGNPVWTNVANTVTIPKVVPSDVFAGQVNPARAPKINDIPIPVDEPKAVVATRSWKAENNDFGTAIPGRAEVGVSDVLNFKTSTHVLNPVDMSVRKLKDVKLTTDKMVVDMMGGEAVKEISPRVSRSRMFTMEYNLPSEILVMDFENKEFKVSNDMEDRHEFLHSLFLEDDNARIGGRKVKKRDDRDRRDRGDRGGGGGDDRGDDGFG